jgi:hypothetical protein
MPVTLTDRLRHVVAGTNGGQIPSPPRAAARIDGRRVAGILAGEWLESADGAVVVIDRFYAPDRRHGREPVGEIVESIENESGALEILSNAWPSRAGRGYSPRLCFFDVETTGLAGGAGTQAFLVGCATVEAGGLHVRQFLLPGFEHERALLASVAEFTATQGTLVSFNGRSFDAPLVETRYLLHRLTFPLADLPHLDMLHPARRLWRWWPVRRSTTIAAGCRCSNAIWRDITGSATCPGSRFRRDISDSCGTARRIPSRPCSSTTGSI